jgi:hypothetical protein
MRWMIIIATLVCGIASAESYKVMSVEDFAIDAPRLATRNASVEITGTYAMHGNVGVLYANRMAVISANNGYSSPPFVPLLADKASHSFRAAMIECQSSYSASQIGCPMTVRGHVTMCTASNVFGALQNTPCVEVLDGEPPPPTPEEIASARAQQERMELDNLLAKTEHDWEQGLAQCLISDQAVALSADAENMYHYCAAKYPWPRQACVGTMCQPIAQPRPLPDVILQVVQRCIGDYIPSTTFNSEGGVVGFGAPKKHAPFGPRATPFQVSNWAYAQCTGGDPPSPY